MDYKEFSDVFLIEMPWQLPGSNEFESQLEILRELVSESEVTVTGNLCKVENGNQITYWVGDAELTNVNLIVDTEITGNFCKVVLTSKNPALPKGSPPFASDVYVAIKNDIHGKNLSLSGDNMMTDDAIRLWSRLIAQGNIISVFNASTNKYELTDVKSSEELTQYIGNHLSYHYVFVLSETRKHYVGVRHAVELMELKRKSGYPLKQLFEQFKGK